MQAHLPKSLWVSLSIALTTISIAHADPPDSDGLAYFETHIRPLLAEHCYQCHSVRTKQREGGLLLDSRAGWSVGGDRGPAIVPGDVDASALIRAVRYTDPDLQMPPEQRLPKNAIARLERWVAMGAPDPRKEALSEDVQDGNPSDPTIGRTHWAFQPLQKPHVPRTRNRSWSRGAIDAFVLARLEAENLQPATDADRRTLARRLYVQLIGLPPTRKQVADFVADERADAVQQLVDQLLGSRHFGERWGRHWLDLARYADSNGLDENFLFREAWRYRNWVIDAMNTNMPFDQFVRDQIAGDLLPYDAIEQRDRRRIAAGFMVVGPKVLLGNDSKKQRMEIADEQVDTIGRAFLGQTLGCARCHDHKFDPIPTSDYYAMAGILTSTKVMQRRYMLGQQRYMEQLIGLGPDGDELNAAYERYWRERPKLIAKHNRAEQALKLLEKHDAKAFEDFAAKHPDVIAKVAADPQRAIVERIKAQKSMVTELNVRPPKIPPRAMTACDGDAPADEHVRLAGQFDRLGELSRRGFLRVISDVEVEIPDGQSGRLQLADWLTDVDRGAGNLTARVLANRVWHHLVGRGVVRTVDNFGRTGEAPSHPQLLDHLAVELIESGWSIKTLVRQIVMSRTFAMSSGHDLEGHRIDPDNRLLWRAHRRRLDPESLRDAMLLAADQLDLRPMDSTVWYLGDQATAVGDNKNRRRTDFACRSVYLPVIRNDLPELFDVFDFADPHVTTGHRSQTMVAMQGLYLLNDDSVMEAAEATAQRLLEETPTDPAKRVDRMFELILGTPATGKERAELAAFVLDTEQRLAQQGGEHLELRAWALACHALFASSRFQLLE